MKIDEDWAFNKLVEVWGDEVALIIANNHSLREDIAHFSKDSDLIDAVVGLASFDPGTIDTTTRLAASNPNTNPATLTMIASRMDIPPLYICKNPNATMQTISIVCQKLGLSMEPHHLTVRELRKRLRRHLSSMNSK